MMLSMPIDCYKNITVIFCVCVCMLQDPCFHALLQYAYENGAFLGCDPPISLRVADGLVSYALILALREPGIAE